MIHLELMGIPERLGKRNEGINMSKSLNRRNFIGTGLTGAVALNAGFASIASSQSGMSSPDQPCKIGLILYTIRDFLKTAEDIAKSFEKVKKIGYDIVEITSCDAVSAEQLAKILSENGLRAVSAHTGWDAVSKDPQKVIDQNKAIGNTHIVVSSMPGSFQSEEGYKNFAKMMSETGAKLAEAGMTFGYHNHSFEYTHYNGVSGQEILVSQSDPKYFNFEIDTYWVQHGGGDSASWIEKVAGRVPTVHMKDLVIFENKPIFAEVGEGNLNWPAILAACQKSQVKYCIVEQDTCQRDPFESIAISIKHMKSWGLS